MIMGSIAPPESVNEATPAAVYDAPPVPVIECGEGEFRETEALENHDQEHLQCQYILSSPPAYPPSLRALVYDSRSSPYLSNKLCSMEMEEEARASLSSEDIDNRWRMSFFARAKKGYSSLISAIIRPPRLLYDPKKELGPTRFVFHDNLYKRTDFDVVCMAVVCSHPSLHCITPKIREEVNCLLLN